MSGVPFITNPTETFALSEAYNFVVPAGGPTHPLTSRETVDEHSLAALEQLQESPRHLIAPIDTDASDFVDSLSSQRDANKLAPEIYDEAVAFLTKLVGWSSRDLNSDTGTILLSRLNVDESYEHATLDNLAMEFLMGCEKNHTVTSELAVTDDGYGVQSYMYLQTRLNNKVHEVTLTRKEVPSGQPNKKMVEYHMVFDERGQHDPSIEYKLSALHETVSVVGWAALSAAHDSRNDDKPLNKFGNVGKNLTRKIDDPN